MNKAEELILDYYSKYKAIPKIKYISTKLDVSSQTASKYLNDLKDRKVIMANPSGGFYVAQPKKLETKIKEKPKKSNDHSLDVLRYTMVEKEDVAKKPKPKSDKITTALRIAMLVVGIGAAIYSTYYTANFLAESLPTILAGGLSFIMVVFSVGAFQTMLIFFKNEQFLLLVVFILIWFVVIMFSMVSTVAGQYNSRAKNFNHYIQDSKEDVQEEITFQILLDEEKSILENIPFLLKDFEEKKVLFNEHIKKDWEYWQIRKRMLEAEKAFNEANEKLEIKRKEKKDFLAQGKTIQQTKKKEVNFYTDVSKIIKVDADLIAFGLSTLPAIFIDVIAPLALAVSMFLGRRKENELG